MSKLVDFSYCKHCEFKDTKEADDPCHECLLVPAREDGSKKPVKFISEGEKKKKK